MSSSSSASILSKMFCAAFASVFEQTSGAPFPLTTDDAAIFARDTETLHYALEVSGQLKGRLTLNVAKSSAPILASILMGGSPGEMTPFLPEHEDALFEIVSQTAGLMATELRGRFGAAEINASRQDAEPSTPGAAMVLRSSSNIEPMVVIELVAEQVLLEALSEQLADATRPSVPTEQRPPQDPAHATDTGSQNLGLIMEVELDLTLRFGQKTLMLSEVADLTTGSVVELDREVDEPVELLLGDRVIAKGEVVIVDGNYGLRITELMSVNPQAILSA